MSVQEVEGRPPRRRAATVERLLDAALQTFAEVGFAAASVEDVCSRGGFTRGAFYSSFRTKDELFGALFTRETARNLARAEEQLQGIEHEADPLGAAVERCLATFRADRTWVLVLTEYRLHAARHPQATAALRAHTTALHTRVTELIETAAARAGLRLTLPAGLLARMVLALHDGMVLQQVPGPTGDAADDSALDDSALDDVALDDVALEDMALDDVALDDMALEHEREALLLLLRAATTH